jgi:hypothetical protein
LLWQTRLARQRSDKCHWRVTGKHILTATLFTGTINADVFFAWLSQDLLPKLPPNSVIVMDNAAFHKRADSQQLIEQAGHLVDNCPLTHLI